MGDIAVDDIVIAAGGCAVQPAHAGERVTYVSPTIHAYTEPPRFIPSEGPYDCYFEVDLCSWSSSIDEVRIYLFILVNKLKYIATGLAY